MERIAVLTSGGDAPGMNACIRAVVDVVDVVDDQVNRDLVDLGYFHLFRSLSFQFRQVRVNSSLVSLQLFSTSLWLAGLLLC